MRMEFIRWRADKETEKFEAPIVSLHAATG